MVFSWTHLFLAKVLKILVQLTGMVSKLFKRYGVIRCLDSKLSGTDLFRGALRKSFFVEDKVLWLVTDYKSFQGSIRIKQKKTVCRDLSLQMTRDLKWLWRTYYYNFQKWKIWCVFISKIMQLTRKVSCYSGVQNKIIKSIF